MRSFSPRNPLKLNDDLQRDGVQYEENNRSYKTPPPSIVEPSKNRSQNVFDASTMMDPIIDYHRHCANCSYDLCLSCCQDLREASIHGVKGELENQLDGRTEYKITVTEQVKQSKLRLKLSDKFFNWKANINGSIPCPSKEYGSCGCLSLTLKRIFKMNWVAKLVKNYEEMVIGCKVYNCNDNFLYCSTSEDIKVDGIADFRNWDPMVIWRQQEKMKDDSRNVKATDFLDWFEVNIELGQFIKGYSKGRIHENGWPRVRMLMQWNAVRRRYGKISKKPNFISKLPLLEYIHSKWGLLNVAAKLPHYSLQNDVGPKIFISYGMNEELGRDSVNNLYFSMRDMVYLLVHTCEVKLKNWQQTKIEKITFEEAEAKESPGSQQISLDEAGQNDCEAKLNAHNDERMDDQRIETTTTLEEKTVNCEDLNRASREIFEKTQPGALWDATRPLYDADIFLNRNHKRKLKEDFGVEPWSFEQHLGQAVFIPAGCPFQSTVQLGLDFLSPESLGEVVRLAEEIRYLPNDNDRKLQMLEVGKISLYAASSAIKEVQKLVLDPKLGAELGFEDPNLTAMVSKNLEEVVKRRQITCV
ncbi:Lysine-specific demethylase JMJ25 [Camellia lanceoleosa]|uniref:Lysine-specific demethylase JMJ25 n=1 Tax=Camellia lanceoleosa TaxID=1840588 RepID=A0ACC0IJP1_9ERIC|nr:Lysine-specific demethylase JMJ25 [Camellia lanceoleosa]